MTRIPVLVKTLNDIVPMADVDHRLSNDLIIYCPECYGTLFYLVVARNYEDTELATDTQFYCAVCGLNHGGIINDPLNELDLIKIPQSSTPTAKKEDMT